MVYRLRYRVLNTKGWSLYSPVSSLLVAGVPDRPGKPKIESTSTSNIVLSFTPSVSNGGSPILRYDLFFRPESSNTFSAVTSYVGQLMTHTMTASHGLQAGEIHYFKLRSTNDVGDSEYSPEASAAFAPLPAALTPAPWVV